MPPDGPRGKITVQEVSQVQSTIMLSFPPVLHLTLSMSVLLDNLITLITLQGSHVYINNFLSEMTREILKFTAIRCIYSLDSDTVSAVYAHYSD